MLLKHSASSTDCNLGSVLTDLSLDEWADTWTMHFFNMEFNLAMLYFITVFLAAHY